MLGGGQPVGDDLLEFLGGHAGVRGHDDFEHRAFATGEGGFHIALEQRGERLFVLPFGMCRGKRLHAVQREEELEIHRLLGPEGAVVVKRRDAFGGRYELRAALSVVACTNSMIAFFAGPSFHEGSASCDSAVPATINSTATNPNKTRPDFRGAPHFLSPFALPSL